jgi:hypothetical protein
VDRVGRVDPADAARGGAVDDAGGGGAGSTAGAVPCVVDPQAAATITEAESAIEKRIGRIGLQNVKALREYIGQPMLSRHPTEYAPLPRNVAVAASTPGLRHASPP